MNAYELDPRIKEGALVKLLHTDSSVRTEYSKFVSAAIVDVVPYAVVVNVSVDSDIPYVWVATLGSSFARKWFTKDIEYIDVYDGDKDNFTTTLQAYNNANHTLDIGRRSEVAKEIVCGSVVKLLPYDVSGLLLYDVSGYGSLYQSNMLELFGESGVVVDKSKATHSLQIATRVGKGSYWWPMECVEKLYDLTDAARGVVFLGHNKCEQKCRIEAVQKVLDICEKSDQDNMYGFNPLEVNWDSLQHTVRRGFPVWEGVPEVELTKPEEPLVINSGCCCTVNDLRGLG